MGEIEPLAGDVQLGASLNIGYFAQAHNDLNPDQSVLDELLRHRNMPLGEARNYLARYLFRQDDVYKQVSMLSGGERGRLALAILALAGANFLLLDEPTNHLDVPAQESLQAALEQFGGTVLLVSHDRYLINRLATQIWELRHGRLHVYQGGYQQYLAERDREAESAREAATAARAASRPERNGSQPSKNERRRHAEELAAVEALISRQEARLQQLGQALQEATEAQTFDKIQLLSVEYEATEAELETLMEQWEKLAHE
jgi:ATP-binding cassette subfamily F protein 3